ncbi:centrosomal protein of 68 kDa isoform X1 [Grus americana]|uniref:centrosomal protein of 68 kDa isoform X1 n=2 Tax=Grus americana TaxID=9117 RepID=UPI002407FA5E|nr:centrosomal protein of 68 kDa isoform X1 [Grus americana]XP_054677226.1 centrosomal protein of 68 kDa isoform X1 [Grus americana]XP_054677227.1 centrosomal protein of 68 kDa isoform X1 [Grus americana]XP_054677228.1 centrosomal protein of 68 kDa isoform X1 [Grus americana]
MESSACRSSVPMAVDVGKSLSEASLSRKAKGDGRWDCAEVETDYPELANSLHRLLGVEEAKPCPQGTESVAMSGRSHLATGITQGGSSYCPEVSSAPTSRFPRARASLSETETLIYRATDGGDVPRHVGHRFLSSEDQQVKALGCWELVSSPPSRRSSAGESILAGGCHDARAGRWNRRLGAQSPFSSTPELLRPQTAPSPESTLRSRSALSFSTLSSEENGLSKEPVRSLQASTDMPSPAATAARDLCCRWGAAEDRVPRARKPFSPLLDDRTTMERIREMSSYQADYWACAIPDSLPPSPDRSSPHWNPNKEYEDLLDYAYPLKPRYKLGKIPEPFFHDSGIGLDSFSVSPEGTSRSTSIYGRGGQARGSGENGRRTFVASAERFSTLGPGKRGCSGADSYYEPLPIAKASFAKSASSHHSRGFAKDVTTAGPGSFGLPAADGRSCCTRRSSFPNYKGQVKSSNRFLPTTRVLPLRKEWEGDEEFLSLPPRLRELERLAQFLSNLSLTIRTPGHDHPNLPCHSDGRQPLSSEMAPFGEAGGRDERGNIEDYGPWQPCSSRKPSWENTESCGRIHRASSLRGLHLPTGLRDALDGTYLNEPQVKGNLKKSQQSESLAQCIKMFCCQLEELIRWLYNVADITDSWVPAMPAAESVKASLHRYLEFRKDVADHRSLTESVLERGEALLDCMASNSPALKDTLGLIAKQSEELETHAEHLYESVLAAVGPMQGEDGMEDEGVQQTSAQWVPPLSDLGFVSQSRDG